MALAVSFSLVSCEGFESKAKKQLKETMMEMAKNPDTFKIENEEVLYSNDSLCIIHFTGKSQNGFGGWDSTPFEYVMVRGKKEIVREMIIDLTKVDCNGEHIHTVIEDADNIFKKLKKKKNMTKEEMYANNIWDLADTECLVCGREVK